MTIEKNSLRTPARQGRTGEVTEITMDTVRHRLSDIFARLFEDLAPEDARGASVATIPDWDGLTTLSLIVEAEDEFGIDLGFDMAEEIMSFSDLYDQVLVAIRDSGRFHITGTEPDFDLARTKPFGTA